MEFFFVGRDGRWGKSGRKVYLCCCCVWRAKKKAGGGGEPGSQKPGKLNFLSAVANNINS